MSSSIDPVADHGRLPITCRVRGWKGVNPHGFSHGLPSIGWHTLSIDDALLVMEIHAKGTIDLHPDDRDCVYLALDSRGQLLEVAGRYLVPIDCGVSE